MTSPRFPPNWLISFHCGLWHGELRCDHKVADFKRRAPGIGFCLNTKVYQEIIKKCFPTSQIDIQRKWLVPVFFASWTVYSELHPPQARGKQDIFTMIWRALCSSLGVANPRGSGRKVMIRPIKRPSKSGAQNITLFQSMVVLLHLGQISLLYRSFTPLK